LRYGKNILILTVAMSIALFFYIRHVNTERTQGINLLLQHPVRGDIYKIRYMDGSGNHSVRYFKVAETTETLVSCYRGKMSGWNVSDVFLDEFDLDRRQTFTYKELQLIKEGKFSNNEMTNASLVEIERKDGVVPENSL
jgi:hypothetical protein